MNYNTIIKKFQNLVFDNLREEWLWENSSNWYDYILSLPEQLRTTYLVVIYHNQVFNGGHNQWFNNRYGQFATETIKSLIEIGATQRVQLLKQACASVNYKKDPDEIFRFKVLRHHPDIVQALDIASAKLNEIDTSYAIDDKEDIETLLGHYLTKQVMVIENPVVDVQQNLVRGNDFEKWALNILKAHQQPEAFALISSQLEKCDDSKLIEYAGVLNGLRNSIVLDWIERQAPRITNVTLSWGHLAASSNFSWEIAETWLNTGRPLSLIALDALNYCTTIGERLNQSLWMGENRPKLLGYPGPEIIVSAHQIFHGH